MLIARPQNLILLMWTAATQARLDNPLSPFIRDYVAYKRIRILAVFACSKYETVQLFKMLMRELPIWVHAGNYSDPWSRAVGVVYNKFGVLLDYNCPSAQGVLQHSAVIGMLNDSSSWLVVSSQPPHASLEVRMDSDLTWATPEESGTIYLNDVYRLTQETPLNITSAGQWDGQSLRYRLTSSRYRRRQNFCGLVFRAAIVVANMPTDHLIERLTSPINRHLDTTTKLNYAINRHMQDMFNFSVQLYPTPSWGYLDEHGAYDGMIGMIQREEVDLGVTSATIKLGRLAVADFVGHTWKFQTYIIFRHPKVVGIQSALFIPFSGEVWMCTGAVWVLVMTALRIVAWFESQRHEGEIPVMSSTASIPENTWSGVVLFAVGTISQRGTSYESKLITWRILIVIAFVLAMMLNAYYSAAIVTALLIPPPKTIRDLRSLIDSPLTVGMEDISFNHDYFARCTVAENLFLSPPLRTSDPLGLELYKKKVKPPGHPRCNCFPLSEGVVKLREGMFAFQAEVSNIYPIIEETFTNGAKCELTLIPLIPHAVTSVPTHKRWPFRKFLSYGLHTAFERGLVQRQMMYWKPQPPRCTELDMVVSIEMSQLLPAFFLLLTGTFLSLLLLGRERCRTH